MSYMISTFANLLSFFGDLINNQLYEFHGNTHKNVFSIVRVLSLRHIDRIYHIMYLYIHWSTFSNMN